MKCIIFAIVALLIFVLAAGAQPPGVQQEIERQQREELQRRMARDLANRRWNLDNLNRDGDLSRRGDALQRNQIKKLYRLPTDEETALLAPQNSDTEKYSRILKRGRSGLIKLMPDLGCDELTLQAARSPKCDLYTVPGGGSAFSFRTGTHRLWLLADLVFDGRNFIAFGQFSQGFMTQLPLGSIEDVNPRSEGVRFISDFVPANQQQAVSKQNLQFVTGVTDGNFTYAKILPATEGGVYVLRSIAYRGRVIRESLGGVLYNELDFDTRRDVIVAFHVVRRSPDGSVTLLWKELRRKEAPKM